MARTVHLACVRCGHPQMVVVGSEENDQTVAEIERDSGGREMAADDALRSAERLRRLRLLPVSLPVGGIITPV